MNRPSAAKRGYDHAWKKKGGHRERQLRRQPCCEFCLKRKIVTVATEVDHIDGDSRNNDPKNLRSLCKSCHSTRTMFDQGMHKGHRRNYGYDEHGRPLDPEHEWG